MNVDFEPDYYVIPNGRPIAAIAKIGSSALAMTIMKTHYPDLIPDSFGEEMSTTHGWQKICPVVKKQDVVINPVIPVRDPIKRFVSSCHQDKINPNTMLSTRRPACFLHRYHFRPISRYILPNSTFVLFPDEIDKLCEYAKIDSLPKTNFAEQKDWPVIGLSDRSIEQVKKIYDEDLKIYNRLSNKYN